MTPVVRPSSITTRSTSPRTRPIRPASAIAHSADTRSILPASSRFMAQRRPPSARRAPETCPGGEPEDSAMRSATLPTARRATPGVSAGSSSMPLTAEPPPRTRAIGYACTGPLRTHCTLTSGHKFSGRTASKNRCDEEPTASVPGSTTVSGRSEFRANSSTKDVPAVPAPTTMTGARIDPPSSVPTAVFTVMRASLCPAQARCDESL